MQFLPLATAYPSDGTPKELHTAFWVIYALAAGIAFVGCVMRMQRGWKSGTEANVAVAAVLIGLIPLAWHYHIYTLDYMPTEMDGTPASPPMWKVLAIPFLPVLAGSCLLLFKRKILVSGRRPVCS